MKAVNGAWGVRAVSEIGTFSRIENGVCGGSGACGAWSAPGKMVYRAQKG
jgi:hypothetical protein